MTEAEMQAIERAWAQHHDDLFPLCPCHTTVLQVVAEVRRLQDALAAWEAGYCPTCEDVIRNCGCGRRALD